MKIFHDIKSVREYLGNCRNDKVGFVPTMGALHQGHLSLIDLAKKSSDVVAVSIFVNQKQFNNSEDFARYPNTLDQDVDRLMEAGVDILFAPKAEEIYGNGFLTNINVEKLGDNLCGKDRKGHFEGMALIVVKLFNIIKPQKVFFGEKDFQQLQIIKRMVLDLNFDIEIIPGKTIREEDGLAISSRNSRLNNCERKIAGEIYQNLSFLKEQIILNANKNIDLILQEAEEKILKIGANKIDYLRICDEKNLQTISIFDPAIKSRLFIAIYVGEIRLIDNISL
ncbi:MAG: pantoate--beta-alanine ligase [Rickettsiales bacterium]|jgi:pantoate--beta-alanine ligase